MAAALADDLHGTVVGWPSFDRWSLGIQLVRSADSVGANIAEGVGRASARDQRRMLVIARGSLFELEHWTTRAGARGLLDVGSYGARIEELARTLAGPIRSIQAS